MFDKVETFYKSRSLEIVINNGIHEYLFYAYIASSTVKKIWMVVSSRKNALVHIIQNKTPNALI